MESRIVFLIGTAGSGKSVLTASLKDKISEQDVSVISVNLDPAVKNLPYEPDVDCRNYVSYNEFLKQGLGPNGALIASVDALVLHIDDILREIEEYNADYILVDTPGQMEVFAYRVGGPMVIRALSTDKRAMTLFLLDALFFENPLSIVSSLALASSVALRLDLPQLNIVSKADLLLPEIVDEVLPRLGEEGFLDSLIMNASDNELTKLMALRLLQAIRETGFIGNVLPVSVFNPDSLDALYAMIQQIVSGGEEKSL